MRVVQSNTPYISDFFLKNLYTLYQGTEGVLSYKPLHLEAQQRLQEEGCVVDITFIDSILPCWWLSSSRT